MSLAQRLLAAALLAVPALAAAATTGIQPRETAAIAALAKQFDAHPLVMLGELHRGKETHAFLQRLLRDPVFICRADDVVVEFGNSRLQPLADAYVVDGADVDEARLRTLWRDTAVPLTWNAPMYRQVFETLHAINRGPLCSHPVRVLLADPPLDWALIHDAKEYAPWDRRDASYAEVVEREVLGKHRRALLIAGRLHAMKQVPADFEMGDDRTVAQRIELAHPGAVFSVITVPLASGAQALRMGVAPSFRAVHGSALETAPYQLADFASTIVPVKVGGKTVWQARPDKQWPRMGEVVDGLLWLGGNTSVYPPPSIYLEPAYLQELRRRAQIIKDYSGQDFLTVIDGLVKEAERDANAAGR